MKNITKILFMFVVVTLLVTMTSCSKKYSVKFISDDEIYKEVEVKKDATVENVAISKEGYEFAGWFLGEDLFDFNTKSNLVAINHSSNRGLMSHLSSLNCGILDCKYEDLVTFHVFVTLRRL